MIILKEKQERTLCVCFTGHRPSKLDISEKEVKSFLYQEIVKSISEGYSIFISGMACGVDMWAAEIVILLKKEYPHIKLVAAVPFEGFEKKRSNAYKEQFYSVLGQANDVAYICPQFSYDCFQKRNIWMVDHSSKVIAVWNGTKSGTKNTIDYAKKCGINTVNVYPK